MKAFDEIMGLVRRYAPTLTAHLLLLVWLSLYVLDTSQLPDGADRVWTWWSGDISKVLQAAGIDAKTWYLAAGLALAYLTLFQWLCRLVTSMPGLRPQLWAPYDADLLSWACEALRLKPDPQAVAQALDYQVKRALERVRQTNQSEPYRHLVDQRLLVTGWYGNVLIFLTIMLIWGGADAPYASSSEPVYLTFVVLLAGAYGLRRYAERLYRRERAGTAYWVLEQVRDPTADSDPLAHERRRAMTQRLEAEARQKKRDAGGLVTAVLALLLRRERLASAWGARSRAHDLDWQVLKARWTRHGAVRPRASALDPASFERQFTSLLEREGSGLAVLTPAFAGLALAGDGGSVYSFLTRRHEHSEFGVSLKGGERLDAGGCRLCLQTGDSEGFIAALGPTPIAKLVAGVAPDMAGEAWRRLRWDTADAPWLGYLEHGRSIDVDGTAAGREAALVFGDSYLLGLRTATGLAARAVLQAFRIADGDRVLIAWCILDAEWPRLEPAKSPAWWSPRRWLGLWKMFVPID